MFHTPDGEVILYAIWKPHQYSVEFYGGSKATGSMEPQSFSYGTSAPLTANAYVRQGYSFKGWTSDSSGTGTVMYSDRKSVKDLTAVDNGVVKLYAIWESQKVDYTVEHFLQDASGTYPTVPTYTEVKQAKADTTVKPPVRNVDSTQYTKPSVASLSVKPDGSSKLIYKYPRKSYTLTVKTGDNTKKVYIDSTSSQTSVTKTIRYGASVTINADPVPSQESELTGPVTYIFEKWTSPRGTSYSQEYTFTMPAANVTYTASCTEEDLYTYVEKTMSDGQVINGTTYHKFTSYSGNPSDKSKADIENTNANEMSDTEGEIYLFAQYSGCSTVALPAAPSRNYYHFSGWNTEADGTGGWIGEDGKTGTLTEQKGENTYYAIWEPYKFTVNFDKNRPVKENYPGLYEGGNTDSETYNNQSSSNVEGSMGSQTFTYDESSTINANKYSLSGWHFKEWNTKPDGKGVSFSNSKKGNIAKMLTDKGLVSNDGDSITLYAIWEQNTYTVEYDKNKPGSTDVAGTMTDQTFVYDRPQKLKSNTYTCSYYHYQKWNIMIRGTGPNYSDGTWIGKGNNLTATNKGTVTLYAQWKPYKFKLKFDKNKPGNASHDVSGSMSDQEITYDARNILYGNRYSLTGWTFTGWKCNGISITNGQELKNLLKSDTDNDTFTLSAQWRQNSFTIHYNANGGSVSPTQKTVKYDEDFSNPIPSRDNWTFTGWSLNVGKNYTSVDGAVIEMTAKWYPRPVPSNFYASGKVVFVGPDSHDDYSDSGLP